MFDSSLKKVKNIFSTADNLLRKLASVRANVIKTSRFEQNYYRHSC